jgi:hypothetical protein
MATTHVNHREAEALYALAHTILEAGRSTDASDVFRAMLLLFPSDERGWLGLGHCHELLDQEAAAIEIYSFALLAVSPAVRTRVALARLLRETGRDTQAEEVLDIAAAAAGTEQLEALVASARRAA